MCTLNSHPEAQISIRFALRPALFEIQFFENRKCTQWLQNDLNHWSIKVPCVHWILTPEAQISLRFAIRPGIVEIQACGKSECTQWPQNDLNHRSVKSTLCTLILTPEAQNSLRFTLRSLVFQIIEVLGFPIGHNGEILKKSLKIVSSKFQNPKQHFCEDHWEENSEKVWKDSKVIWGRSSVLKFWLP